MTYRDVLRMGEQKLSMADVAESGLNAWYLFAHCFSMDKNQFFLRGEEQAPELAVSHFNRLLDFRRRHIPLEYITHETEFMGLPFYVDESVLIPRQDTECLVEEVLKVCGGKDVLDLCTGSGCIGISLAVLGNCSSVTLSDISGAALEVAERNAEKNGADVYMVKSDLFQTIGGKYDVIVSNPPYIPGGVIEGLMPEVREHEPRLALDGGEDGLSFYRSIISESRMFLREEGMLFFEIGCDQGMAVSKLMRAAGFCRCEVKKDLAGLDRIVCGQIGGEHV